jgi:hypothetical protein
VKLQYNLFVRGGQDAWKSTPNQGRIIDAKLPADLHMRPFELALLYAKLSLFALVNSVFCDTASHAKK